MNKVSNPLTIIAIFAGLAQTAGTVVLPLVSESLQSIFIWYVMGFPVVLVLIFFATLNFNPKVLYAPSDFQNEQHFVDLINKRIGERIEQQIEEVKEEKPELATELENIKQNIFISGNYGTGKNIFLKHLLENHNKDNNYKDLNEFLNDKTEDD